MINELATGIYSRLSGGTALTALLSTIPGGTAPAIYHLQAEEGATYPYLVYSLQGGGDENLDANRTKQLSVFVRGYSKSSAAQAGSIDAAADTLLHLSPLTVSGWTNIFIARETDLDTVENDPSGLAVFMQGGLYRVHLDQN